MVAMRPLILAAAAAALLALTPASHAYPAACADVVDRNGAHTTVCTPFLQMYGRECATVEPGWPLPPYVTSATACVATPLGGLHR